mmetsp:Transcript_25901/g.64321  ORF Transcript_25901/g.64321 Transcript_25901/m.64321 type:complete len:128 (-) Transcript_25901:913-1296(-)
MQWGTHVIRTACSTREQTSRQPIADTAPTPRQGKEKRTNARSAVKTSKAGKHILINRCTAPTHPPRTHTHAHAKPVHPSSLQNASLCASTCVCGSIESDACHAIHELMHQFCLSLSLSLCAWRVCVC